MNWKISDNNKIDRTESTRSDHQNVKKNIMSCKIFQILAMSTMLFVSSSCSRQSKPILSDRLEKQDAIQKEFNKITPTLYPAGAVLPKLDSMLSSQSHSFMLKVQNKEEFMILSSTFSGLIRKYKVEDIVVIVLAQEQIIDGQSIKFDNRSIILGTYRVDDAGNITELNTVNVAEDMKNATNVLLEKNKPTLPLSNSAETKNSTSDVSGTSIEKDQDKALRDALLAAGLEMSLYVARNGGRTSEVQPELKNSPARKEIMRLIENGADLTIRDKDDVPEVLVAGITLGWEELVNKTLDAGVDVNAPIIGGDNALFALVAMGDNGEMAALFVERGIDITKKSLVMQNSSLAKACSNGRYKIVKALLEAHANTEEQAEQGWTPLLSAAQMGHLEIVKLLDDHGANLHYTDDRGYNALYAAISNGCLDVFVYLLDRGVDPFSTSKNGGTLLGAAYSSLHSWEKNLRDLPEAESFLIKVKNLQKIIEILEDMEEDREPQN